MCGECRYEIVLRMMGSSRSSSSESVSILASSKSHGLRERSSIVLKMVIMWMCSRLRRKLGEVGKNAEARGYLEQKK